LVIFACCITTVVLLLSKYKVKNERTDADGNTSITQINTDRTISKSKFLLLCFILSIPIINHRSVLLNDSVLIIGGYSVIYEQTLINISPTMNYSFFVSYSNNKISVKNHFDRMNKV